MERAVTIPLDYVRGKKIRKMARLAGLKLAEAIGIAVELWLSAVDSYDGFLDKDSVADEIPVLDADMLFDALSDSGLVQDGVLTGWNEFAAEKAEAMERTKKVREQNRIRKQRQRDRERIAKQENFDFFAVTRDVPKEDSAGDYRGNNNINTSGGGDVDYFDSLSTEKSEKNENECGELLKSVETVENTVVMTENACRISDYWNIRNTEHLTAQCGAIARMLIPQFAGRSATEYDIRQVFKAVGDSAGKIDQDKVGLLTYAVEASAVAGRGGNWSYIGGVLRRIAERGLKTVSDVQNYDRCRMAMAQ